MKKTLLALTVPALLVAGVAQAATVYDKDGQTFDVYGRVQANLYNKAASDSDKTSLVGTARFGVKGTQAVNSQYGVFGRGEWQVNAENSTSSGKNFKSRHVYAGVDGKQLGKLTVGQTDTPYYTAALSVTDVFNEWGDAGNNYLGRQEGQFIYNNTIGGFTVGTSFQTSDKSQNLDNGYTAGLSYAFPFTLTLNAGYSNVKYDDSSKKEDWALSSSYGTFGEPGFYAAGLYNQTKYDAGIAADTPSSATTAAERKTNGYELASAYFLPNNIGFLAGYNFLKQKDGDDLVKEYLLGAQYTFTPKAYVYTEYKFNQIKDADNQWTVAMQYNF